MNKEKELLEHSKYFDKDYYLETYKDVKDSGYGSYNSLFKIWL